MCLLYQADIVKEKKMYSLTQLDPQTTGYLSCTDSVRHGAIPTDEDAARGTFCVIYHDGADTHRNRSHSTAEPRAITHERRRATGRPALLSVYRR